MTAPKPTAEQIAEARALAGFLDPYGTYPGDDGADQILAFANRYLVEQVRAQCTCWRLTEDIPCPIHGDAYQRGREAGIREAAEWLRPRTTTAVSACLLNALLPADPPAAPDCRSCGGSGLSGALSACIRCNGTGRAAPLTGPELAAKYGFPPLAESGAARVPGVPQGEAECTCFDCDCKECKANNRRCVLHGRAAGKP